MGFESPVLLRLAAGVGSTGEAATIMRPMGSSHLIASRRQQLELCAKEADPGLQRVASVLVLTQQVP